MDDSIAHPSFHARPLELPAWKTILSVSSAVILAVFFVLAGVWKITYPYGAAVRFKEMLMPGNLSLPFPIALAVMAPVRAVFLWAPRFRRSATGPSVSL